jgi:hypothetical protein
MFPYPISYKYVRCWVRNKVRTPTALRSALQSAPKPLARRAPLGRTGFLAGLDARPALPHYRARLAKRGHPALQASLRDSTRLCRSGLGLRLALFGHAAARLGLDARPETRVASLRRRAGLRPHCANGRLGGLPFRRVGRRPCGTCPPCSTATLAAPPCPSATGWGRCAYGGTGWTPAPHPRDGGWLLLRSSTSALRLARLPIGSRIWHIRVAIFGGDLAGPVELVGKSRRCGELGGQRVDGVPSTRGHRPVVHAAVHAEEAGRRRRLPINPQVFSVFTQMSI